VKHEQGPHNSHKFSTFNVSKTPNELTTMHVGIYNEEWCNWVDV